jgi:hypothetical protein
VIGKLLPHKGAGRRKCMATSALARRFLAVGFAAVVSAAAVGVGGGERRSSGGHGQGR